MAEYIREVEKIIDAYHKQNPLFSLNRKTAFISLTKTGMHLSHDKGLLEFVQHKSLLPSDF